MIRIIKLTIFTTLISLAGSVMAVQFATVDVQKLLRETPHSEKARSRLESEFEPRQKELVAAQKKIREGVDRLQKQRLTLKPEQIREREEEIQSMEADLQRKARLAQQEFNARREEEDLKVREELSKAIEAIAKKRKLDMVIFSDAVAWKKKGTSDVTDAVIEYLDKDSKK